MTLSQRLLAVLGESPLPMRTPDLVTTCAAGLSHPRQRVRVALLELERGGLVRRVRTEKRREVGHTVVWWALA